MKALIPVAAATTIAAVAAVGCSFESYRIGVRTATPQSTPPTPTLSIDAAPSSPSPTATAEQTRNQSQTNNGVQIISEHQIRNANTVHIPEFCSFVDDGDEESEPYNIERTLTYTAHARLTKATKSGTLVVALIANDYRTPDGERQFQHAKLTAKRPRQAFQFVPDYDYTRLIINGIGCVDMMLIPN